MAPRLDEYQDGISAGSLAKARRCWHDLVAIDALSLPQRFTFAFRCCTRAKAVGLTDFLRYTRYAGYVRLSDRVNMFPADAWEVKGTTHATVWSLASIERLFMDLRDAGSRYASTLESVELLRIL